MTEIDLQIQASRFLAGNCSRPSFEDAVMRTTISEGPSGWWGDVELAIYEGIEDEVLRAVVRRSLPATGVEADSLRGART